jgi:hypothetical protein
MQRKLCSITVLALAITMALFALPSNSQTSGTTGPAVHPDAAGHWHGVWTAPGGWVYEADFQLAPGLGGAVLTDIHWTLRAADASRTDYQGKVGMTGVEHVRGQFFPNYGYLTMEGYGLDDPNKILGMDSYRLVLSDDGSTLGGITGDHGDWNGQLIAKRQAN